jgi:hypothetical protein
VSTVSITTPVEPVVEKTMSHAGLAWAIDAFSLAMGGLLQIGGRLGDLIGRRRTLTIGITLPALYIQPASDWHAPDKSANGCRPVGPTVPPSGVGAADEHHSVTSGQR